MPYAILVNGSRSVFCDEPKRRERLKAHACSIASASLPHFRNNPNMS